MAPIVFRALRDHAMHVPDNSARSGVQPGHRGGLAASEFWRGCATRAACMHRSAPAVRLRQLRGARGGAAPNRAAACGHPQRPIPKTRLVTCYLVYVRGASIPAVVAAQVEPSGPQCERAASNEGRRRSRTPARGLATVSSRTGATSSRGSLPVRRRRPCVSKRWPALVKFRPNFGQC